MEPDGTTDFLVVGAGLAGIAFAGDVARGGRSVRLLDKARGVGGRAATRRVEDGGAVVRVDHGAQYFTARGERFREIVAGGLADGWVRVWADGFPVWRDGEVVRRPGGHARYAPPEGMSALPKRLARGLDVRAGAAVAEIARRHDSGEWQARCADGRAFTGRSLVLTMPPAQLLSLAGDLVPAETSGALRAVEQDPAWTLIAALERDVPGADWPGLEFDGHPVLGWAARDHTRRGDPAAAPPVLVAHANGAWSREHLEDDPADVLRALLGAAGAAIGPLAVSNARVHRWRYAQPTRLFPAPFFWHAERGIGGIGGCGDWCDTGDPLHGAKVEAALVSGWRLAAAAG